MTNYIKYEVKVYTNGDKYWYLNGKLHREDGPAFEGSSGEKSWYLNGKPHREDGPAEELRSGNKYWYLNGKLLTEKEFNKRMTPTVEMTMAQINEALGKNVKVVK
jgi:antitoxin component YwqK of YwqJK toxin-antitoxin module